MKRYEINRLIRKTVGLSGKQLADAVEVTKQTISNYERGLSCSRPVERVIELELDLAIERCNDENIKYICGLLKNDREKGD